MEKQQTKKAKKGVVVSDKMDKTIVVEATTLLTHKKYHKKYKDTKRYSVHDENNSYKVGDKVLFNECKPMSKSKKWIVIEQDK
ncbi:MAG: 30S ribosomal protein S17 [Patescibacteria group bacterium]|nr:30S ribosomal protein S17 [Patescibacteria group bacterium]